MFLILLACTGDKHGSPDSPRLDSDSAPPVDSEPADADADGYAAAEDCDDGDPAVHPGAVEACDGVDQDCDGTIDEDAGTEWYLDADGDGFAGGSPVLSCDPVSGGVAESTDCDDADPSTWPGAPEVCGERADLDCDGYHAACDLEASDVTVLGDTRYDAMDREAATLAGDLDGDGAADLVLASHNFPRDGNYYTVSVVSGSVLAAGGAFTLTEDALTNGYDRVCGDEETQTWFGWHLIYAGDVDGGGGDDLVINVQVCGESGDSGFWYVRGEDIAETGDLSLETAHFFGSTDGSLDSSGAGDLDGDGIVDLGFTGSASAVYLFNGSNYSDWEITTPVADADSVFLSDDTYGASRIPTRMMDLDGDGTDDFIVETGEVTSLFLGGVPEGSFTAADRDLSIPEGEWSAKMLNVAEFDGDGLADLMVSLSSGDDNWNVIFRGREIRAGATLDYADPDVSLAPSDLFYTEFAKPQGDVDGDGRDDLATWANPGGHPDVSDSTTWLIYGADLVDGTLDPTVIGTPFVGAPERQVLPGRGGDVNGDGLSDLLLLEDGAFETDEEYDDTYHVVFGR